MKKIFDFITSVLSFIVSFVFGTIGCLLITVILLILVVLVLVFCPIAALVFLCLTPFIALANWESLKDSLNFKVTVNKKEEEK